VPAPTDHAVIGKGLLIKGEITGTESLYIDGRVEGSINIPNERVTIGQHGRVVSTMSATMNVCITAREIVIMGKVTGNVSASDRVDIRAEGNLTGDVSTSRISIADGAYFNGGVDIRKADAKSVSMAAPMEVAKMA
jgi:cytoskeletal protein CcmA (bactofilin family)